MNNKLVPALIGGASIFLISLLLALIPYVGSCTCLLAIVGGTLAAYLYIKNSPSPVSSGDGLIVGALAGVVTGLLRLAYIAITFLINRAGFERMMDNIQTSFRQAGVNVKINLHLIFLAGVILAVVMLIVVEAIGGLVGVALFEKRKGETNLPPPPLPPDGSDLPGSAQGF
ncbi:MAG: hypothetical protein WCF57_07195 [Pyrinomonadaceae bacterium]